MLLAHLSAIGIIGDGVAPPPPPPAAAVQPSGGFPAHDRARTRKQVSEARKRFGLEDTYKDERAAQVIANVAARQAEALEQDELKRFEELSRQLQLEGLEFDRRYLELLNQERERLIDLEIAQRFKYLREQEEIILMLLAAAAV